MKEYKCIIVGLNGVGKTSILYRLMLDEVVDTKPTIGSNVEEIQYKNVKFVMWDIGGQESLRASWPNYYSDAAVIIFVLDSTDRERLPITKKEMYDMLKHERLVNSKLLVLANKNDLKGAMSQAEVSEFLGLTSLKDHTWHIQSCCALTGEGYEISFKSFIV